MGYQTIKEGIGKMLLAKGFYESGDVFNFKDESDQNVDKKFRVQRPEIDAEGEGVEFLQTLVRPIFTYKIFLGFKISVSKQTFDYDVSQNLLDVVIAYFNNPTNYTSYCIMMKTKKIKTDLVDDHLEVEIDLEVIDDITLA